MGIIKFEDIVAWQKSRELVLKIYSIFKNSKDFGFKNQIERAAVSVMNNIAEGFERRTNNEFKYFLYVAKGSNGEVRSMLYLALDLSKISENEFKELYDLSNEISKILTGLIKTLN
ncbi:MAG: four helix bundle protein [Bacteroidales bacterium]|nr:four helix bundle protein [Bacteroidales bacterium]